MKRALLLVFLCFHIPPLFAQQIIRVDQKTEEHIFSGNEIVCLEDTGSRLTFDQVRREIYNHKFIANKNFYPKNYIRSASYWYRIKINQTEDRDTKSIIEFFDQTTDYIETYTPDGKGNYQKAISGSNFKFPLRLFVHKNFEFAVNALPKGTYTYYFKVKSKEQVNVIIVFRTIKRFVQYTLTEYFTFGLFYGMILIFSLHNLLMFLAVKRRQYLYYVLYILSVGVYEMSTDGIAFQYLWPNHPILNDYAYGIALYFLSIFALVFTKELLHVKNKAPMLNRIINAVLIARTVFVFICLFYNTGWFQFKFVEFIPLSIVFFTGIWIWLKKDFRPARFFVLGYFFLFLGFVIKVIYILGYARNIPGALGHYSLGFGFIMEMVFLSFAIGDQVRLLKKKKETAQKQIIRQMQINVDLKDSINKELEVKVEVRTKEVIQKSKELFDKSVTIEQQNEELISKNLLLEQQSDEIFRMNALLQNDNITLKTSIEKVTDARLNATDLDFDEFSVKYPDRDSCYKFLADLKWEKGYECIKCGNSVYCNGRVPFNRRCTKCAYEESVLLHTIFENNRIPINKAFYLVYLMYNHKGAISSHKLSEKLDIRQSTCWTYAVKVKKVMDERKKELKGEGKSGWKKLIIYP